MIWYDPVNGILFGQCQDNKAVIFISTLPLFGLEEITHFIQERNNWVWITIMKWKHMEGLKFQTFLICMFVLWYIFKWVLWCIHWVRTNRLINFLGLFIFWPFVQFNNTQMKWCSDNTISPYFWNPVLIVLLSHTDYIPCSCLFVDL